jgi:hypothetical protein
MEAEQGQAVPVQVNHLVNLGSGASGAPNEEELGHHIEDEEEPQQPSVVAQIVIGTAELKRARDAREDLWPMEPMGNMKVRGFYAPCQAFLSYSLCID